MIKPFFFTLFMVFVGVVFAQEPLKPVLTSEDSLFMEPEGREMPLSLPPELMFHFDPPDLLKLPVFDFSEALSGARADFLSGYSFYGYPFRRSAPGSEFFLFSPFLRNSAIFSQGSFRLGDKFTVGGYSFGANTVFTAPFPNQGMNNFDVRGSTLFMEYKVSKNFRIGTQINVIREQGPGF